jgi:hypothetical protein
MDLKNTPRRKKALLLSLGVVGLALVLTVAVTVQRRLVSADVDTTGATLETLNDTLSLLVKTTDDKGNPVAAFLDANVDDGNCTVDDYEVSNGVVGETATDGTGVLDLAYDVNYTITATAKDDTRVGTSGVEVGSGVTVACAQRILAPNTEPLTIKVK